MLPAANADALQPEHVPAETQYAAAESIKADPENNYYSIFVKSCGTGAIDIWNVALTDRTELQIKLDLAEFGLDPLLLYFKLAQMGLDMSLNGGIGTNFYPRTVAYKTAEPDL